MKKARPGAPPLDQAGGERPQTRITGRRSTARATPPSDAGLGALAPSRGSEGETPGLPSGAQTLLRGLDLLEAVVPGPLTLPDLSARLGLNRSTVHRLAAALVDRGYLRFTRRRGYSLGAKLLELGFAARQQIDLARLARPILEHLADTTSDTVHLGILDAGKALYIDKIPGRRRIDISSRVGERHSLCATGLGKALLLDETPAAWQARFRAERPHLDARAVDLKTWLKRMKTYAARGFALDLEENEDRVRCVAAPIRDEQGAIAAALSVSSAAHYMDDARMHHLTPLVTAAAHQISAELGWRG
jgi:DNA-binding IclR family transcriptional regulator